MLLEDIHKVSSACVLNLQPPSSLFTVLCFTVAKVVCLTVANVVVCRHDAEYQHLLLADILVDTDRQTQHWQHVCGYYLPPISAQSSTTVESGNMHHANTTIKKTSIENAQRHTMTIENERLHRTQDCQSKPFAVGPRTSKLLSKARTKAAFTSSAG